MAETTYGMTSETVLISDRDWARHVRPVVDGDLKKGGLLPRDYKTNPVGSYRGEGDFSAIDVPLIPRDQWAERIKEMWETESSLIHLRRTSGPGDGYIDSLDQDGVGYCWNHSVTMCAMIVRAAMGLPYVRLSAFFIGCLVKNYRDEGGWGAQALEFALENGIPSVEFWPEKSMQRSNDNAATRANALKHKVIEGWADLGSAVYDRNLSEDQAMSLLLARIPVIGDFNWWSHSVAILAPVMVQACRTSDLGSLDFNDPNQYRVFADAFGKRGINSWTNQWGEKGEFVLQGTKARLDGGAAIRAVKPSNN